MTKLLQMIHGRYLVHCQVGSGGFGAVYQADDTLLQRSVALKEIAIDQQTAGVPYCSPLHEARMLASYVHAHIPHVYDVFCYQDVEDLGYETCYIVMEWLEGEPLSVYRRTLGTAGKPQIFRECIRLSIQLCQVVRFLHEQQPVVVLRDIKPGNLVVTRRGKLYLVDFGAVKHFASGLVQDQHPCGSYGYQAPELRDGTAQSSPITDIFSLGVTLYELFFQASPVFENGEPTIEYAECPELAQILCSMMAKEPHARPQTVREVCKVFLRLKEYARTHPARDLKDRKVFGSEPPLGLLTF